MAFLLESFLECHRNTPDCILPGSHRLLIFCVFIVARRTAAWVATATATRRIFLVVGGVASVAISRWGAWIGWGGCRAGCGVHSLDGGVEVLGLQLACGSGSQSETYDVLRHAEVVLGEGTFLHDEPEAEDGDVGELHVLAEQQEFLGAGCRIGQHAEDGSLGVRGVVARHVVGEFFETDGLIAYDSWKPFAVGFLDFLVCVLV